MTSVQVVACLVQQAEKDGLKLFPGATGVEADGPAEMVDGWGKVVLFLREAFLNKSHPECFDTLLCWYLRPSGGLNWERLDPDRRPTEHETRLTKHVGDYVWISDSVFVFGRLEGVVPGTAIISARGSPNLPAERLARFRERMRNALPFSSLSVEPGCIRS